MDLASFSIKSGDAKAATDVFERAGMAAPPMRPAMTARTAIK
jgi:hypothetical protein